MRYQNYNYKGWEHTNPGWHEFTITNTHFDGWHSTVKFEEKYQEVVQWLYDHIDNCERHARWILLQESIRVKFRYEKDYAWCALRWG